jgi:hypothetical protein
VIDPGLEGRYQDEANRDRPERETLEARLTKRARAAREAVAVFYDLPPLAQTALYGIAAELDEAIAVLTAAPDALTYEERLDYERRILDESERRIAAENKLLAAPDARLAEALAVADDVLRMGENDGSYNASVIQEALNRLDALAAAREGTP